MPEIHLRPIELNRPQTLPDCCLVCGRSPATLTEVRFSYNPNYLLSMVTRVTVTRWIDTEVPLCARHTNYFMRYMIAGFCGVGVFLLIVLSAFVGSMLTPLGGTAVMIAVPVGFVWGFFFIGGMWIYRWSMVHTNHIDERGMRLLNVSPRFIQELEDARHDRGEKPRNRRDDSGSSVLAYLGIVLVGGALVLFLGCAGLIALVAFGVNHQVEVASGENLQSVDDALAGLRSNDRTRKQGAVRWLAKQPVDAGRQTEVAQALDAILQGDEQLRPDVILALKTWATRDNVVSLSQFINKPPAQNANSEYHVAAIETLGRLKDPRAAGSLTRYLGYPFKEGESAQNALTAIGPAAEKDVLKHYNSADGTTRNRARAVLTGYRTNNRTLVEQCRDDLASGDAARKLSAAQSLTSLALEPQLRPALAKLLGDCLANNDALCTAALDALKAWGTNDNVPRLVQIAGDARFGDNRNRAAAALANLKDARAAGVLADRLPAGDANALQALQEIGAEAAPAVIPYLNHPNAKNSARSLLKEYGVKNDVLIKQCIDDLKGGAADRHVSAAEFLWRAPVDEKLRPDAARALAPLAKKVPEFAYDNDPIVGALCRWATKDIVPDLMELLKHRSAPIHNAVIQACVDLKDGRIADTVVQRWVADTFNRARWRQALVTLGPACEDAVCKTLLPHKDRNWQRDGCLLLKEVGTAASVPALEEAKQRAVKDKVPQVSQAADEAIKAIKARP